jgi:hypothetical protein
MATPWLSKGAPTILQLKAFNTSVLENDVLFLRGVPADSNAAASGESSELGM